MGITGGLHIPGFEQDKKIRDLHNKLNESIGLLKYLSGEQIGISTDVVGFTSYGYGELDFNGFFEFPVKEKDFLRYRLTNTLNHKLLDKEVDE